MTVRRRFRSSPWPLAAPFVIGVTALVAVPTLAAVVLAFTDHAGVGEPSWVGTENFRRMFDDGQLGNALRNTVVFVAIAVPLRVLAAAGLALVLHRPRPGIAAARAAAYLPTALPEVAWALLWLWILNPVFGPLTGTAEALGLPAPDVLTDPWGARLALPVIAAFQMGEGFVVALAWRRQLSTTPYQAAALAGASPWFMLRRLTLPRMAPVLALLAARDVLIALQLGFGPALLITDGGPREATTYVSTYVYDQVFRWFRFGYGAAISVTILLATAVVAWLVWLGARDMARRNA